MEDQQRLNPLESKVFLIPHMHQAPHHFLKIIPAVLEVRNVGGRLQSVEGSFCFSTC